MTYSTETLVEIYEKYREINNTHDKLLLRLTSFQRTLTNEKAREYLMQGVGRRLKTLTRCICNIFSIFPPEQSKRLSKDELTDIDINLHAFFINIAGIFDNLAWAFVHENDLLGKTSEGKIPKIRVGLFNKETQKNLKTALNDYLNSATMKLWYEGYSKIYRDSLAHRIPLYVPQALVSKDEKKKIKTIEEQLQELDFSKVCDIDKHNELRNKQQTLGRASHFFGHSPTEGNLAVYFHAQVLSDYATVEEIIDKFCKNFS